MLAALAHLRAARDHRWTPGRLSAYLDGELGARSVARIERHLAGCGQCLAALRGLERLLRTLHGAGAEPRAEPVPDIAAGVRRRLHQPPPG